MQTDSRPTFDLLCTK